MRCALLGWADLQLKLEALFGRRVHLVRRGAIDRSQNPYRRNARTPEAFQTVAGG